jgi:hypothetical protein
MLFYYAALKHANSQKISKAPSFVVLIFCLSEIAMFSYPTPHELHNVFGSLSMVGWFFPLIVAISWQGTAHSPWFSYICYILFIANLAAIYWMLSPIDVAEDNPFAGIAQRISFLTLYVVFGVVGFSIYTVDKMPNE